MRNTGFVFIALLLAQLGLARGQELPKPLPENDERAHAQAVADAQYPSARVCGQCHPNQYKQLSISSHAYANVSPMFNKFEQRINDISRGTVNYFCIRCHASVGTALGERRDIAWWDRSAAAREGITCVTCHRNPRALAKGRYRVTLFMYLQDHYASSSRSAWELASYLASIDAPRSRGRKAGANSTAAAGSKSSIRPPGSVPQR